jgi:hypothetical protein
MMRMSIASALAMALALPPGVARAGNWSPEQEANMKRIIALRNGGALGEAVTLAQQEFARADASKGYRRAVAREGKAAAIKVFEQDRATPRAAAAVAALCVAVDLMRTYQAELIESDNDRLKIPPEVMRLEALATTAAAPCAPAPASPAPQPPLVAAKPAKPVPALEGPASPPQDRFDRQRSRARVGVGRRLGDGRHWASSLGMTAALVGRPRLYDERIVGATRSGRAAREPRPDGRRRWPISRRGMPATCSLERAGAVLGGLRGSSVSSPRSWCSWCPSDAPRFAGSRAPGGGWSPR